MLTETITTPNQPFERNDSALTPCSPQWVVKDLELADLMWAISPLVIKLVVRSSRPMFP